MNTALATRQIDTPGVYDLPAEAYHADPVAGGSLSSSGARRLLPPSCPALFQQWATVGQDHKAAFDFGHAAHALVLGIGAPITVIEAASWRTTTAQNEQKAAYAAGATPLLRADYEQVRAMAAALRTHPIASALFQPGRGDPEQTLIWIDQGSGIWRRAMLDWLPESNDHTRLIIPDYKTTKSAHPLSLSKALYDYGYIQQAAWYLDGIDALGLSPHGEPAFVFVFQEKTPPHLVTVVQPSPESVQWGRVLNRKAIDLYQQCSINDDWPGYPGCDEVISLSIPRWAEYQLQAAWERGDLDPATPLTEAMS